MKLIGSLGSPFVRKVRIFAIEKNISFDFECMDVWNADSEIAHFNPLGKVPCLLLENGASLIDSRTIIDYFDSINPSAHLIPKAPLDRAVVKTTEALADGILDAAILARREVIFRPPDKQSQEWIERQMEKVDKALGYVSESMLENRWCHFDKFGLADIALGSALDWLKFRLPNYHWEKRHNNLSEYLKKLSLRPSFISTAPKD